MINWSDNTIIAYYNCTKQTTTTKNMSWPSGNLPVSHLKPTWKWNKLQFIEWPLEAGCKSESNLYLLHVKNV